MSLNTYSLIIEFKNKPVIIGNNNVLVFGFSVNKNFLSGWSDNHLEFKQRSCEISDLSPTKRTMKIKVNNAPYNFSLDEISKIYEKEIWHTLWSEQPINTIIEFRDFVNLREAVSSRGSVLFWGQGETLNMDFVEKFGDQFIKLKRRCALQIENKTATVFIQQARGTIYLSYVLQIYQKGNGLHWP